MVYWVIITIIIITIIICIDIYLLAVLAFLVQTHFRDNQSFSPSLSTVLVYYLFEDKQLNLSWYDQQTLFYYISEEMILLKSPVRFGISQHSRR